jgi:hypothetical protein
MNYCGCTLLGGCFDMYFRVRHSLVAPVLWFFVVAL